jgi:hypothetical protein
MMKVHVCLLLLLEFLRLSSPFHHPYLKSKSCLFASKFIDSFVLEKREVKTALQVGLISAPLGTLLDNFHGLFSVLEYNAAFSSIEIDFPGTTLAVLKTSAWTPFLFSYAGAMMTYLLFIFEKQTKFIVVPETWSRVFLGIGLFGLQYLLSAILDSQHIPNILIHCILITTAILGTITNKFIHKPGLILAILTMLVGPIVEILLINSFHLYEYTHADILRICSWIPWIYFLGASAVGMLAVKLREVNKVE